MLTALVILLGWLVISVALGLVMGRICEGYPSDEEIEGYSCDTDHRQSDTEAEEVERG